MLEIRCRIRSDSDNEAANRFMMLFVYLGKRH